MEILIVVLLLVTVAALAFAWMKSRPGASGSAGHLSRRGGGGLRGRRRTASASRHDPMAEAVERHARATDPHEAAEEELRLRAQANRVAADLHAREAASLESQTRGLGGRGHAVPAHEHGQPAYGDRQPLYEDGTPIHADDRPLYEDEHGRPVYEDGTPVQRDDRPRY